MNDEALIVVLVSIPFLALIGGLVYLGIRLSRLHRANLEHAASRLGGRVVASFWKGSGLEWTIDGIDARLRYFIGTDKAPPWTRIQFQWAAAGTVRIVPEGFFARLRKVFGAEDLQIGDPTFDPRFLIQGTPASWVREVLDPDVRRRLEALWELGSSRWFGKGIRLEAGPAGVTLLCYRNLVGSRDHLLAFIGHGLAILGRLKAFGSSSEGVLSAETAAAEGRCPVCGQVLEDRLHRCRACTTLHHEECWTYFGGCAIYACSQGGGTRVRLKKVTD